MIPENYLYTAEHEWIHVDGDTALIGITEFAAEQLGDVVAVELPEEGEAFSAGDEFGTVESVKAVSDLYMPVDGVILAVNTPLNDSPEYVNEDPYEEGWMVKIRITGDISNLLSAAQYREQVEAES